MADGPKFGDLLVSEDEAETELQALVNELEEIDENNLPALERWYDRSMDVIKSCFESQSVANYFYFNSGFNFTLIMGRGKRLNSANKKRASGIIKRIKRELRAKNNNHSDIDVLHVSSRKIFLVHGRDDAAREAVARVVSKLQLEPIILHEQPNKGATLIEKFEKHADVGFAIILLTPDDEGRVAGVGDFSFRARQNVILEMGYFIGRLGRDHVMVLRKGDIEIPSDIFGVVYEPLDDGGAWRFKLGKELQAAGYDVDLNKL